MEIDFLYPEDRGADAVPYDNLFLTCRHCKLAKGNYHSEKADAAMDLQLLNPCEEQDYGVHLFEDPETHVLIGATPRGRLHIHVFDLNAPYFVEQRRLRTELLHRIAGWKVGTIPPQLRVSVNQFATWLIPPIPSPPPKI